MSVKDHVEEIKKAFLNIIILSKRKKEEYRWKPWYDRRFHQLKSSARKTHKDTDNFRHGHERWKTHKDTAF
jgi:hypothetical protein